MSELGTKKAVNPFIINRLTTFVIPLGFEPKTHSLEGCCSIQLSYGTMVGGCKVSDFSANDKP